MTGLSCARLIDCPMYDVVNASRGSVTLSEMTDMCVGGDVQVLCYPEVEGCDRVTYRVGALTAPMFARLCCCAWSRPCDPARGARGRLNTVSTDRTAVSIAVATSERESRGKLAWRRAA